MSDFALAPPPSASAGRYKTILADPPWMERGAGKTKRGADRHYPLMHTRDIAALQPGRLAHPEGAHLWLWVTNNFLADGLEVMRAWGFRYVSNCAWVKTGAEQLAEGITLQQGLGQYIRGSHELCLFGVRGTLPYKLDQDGKRCQTPSVWVARRGRHSAKPDVSYEAIERVSHGPRLEMFCRSPRPGWDVWGNEVASSVELSQ